MYGTVRTVVWEDGGGNPASYPIPAGGVTPLLLDTTARKTQPVAPTGQGCWLGADRNGREGGWATQETAGGRPGFLQAERDCMKKPGSLLTAGFLGRLPSWWRYNNSESRCLGLFDIKPEETGVLLVAEEDMAGAVAPAGQIIL